MGWCAWRAVGLCVLALVWPVDALAQATSSQAEPQVQVPKDALGRDTPRGTVTGFLTAARRGEAEIARQYLDARVSGRDTDELVHQLFVVLDARLPARISQISDAPEGSRSNPLKLDHEIVGTIASPRGDVDVIVARISSGRSGPVWLFSQATLGSVPALYEEVTIGWAGYLPRFLTSTRVGGIRVFELLAALLGLPLFYLLTLLLNKILTPLLRPLWRGFARYSDLFARDLLPVPIRILFLAFAIRWFLASLPLSFLIRQIWSQLASLLTVIGVVWLLVLINGEIELYIRRRFPRSNQPAAATLVRVLRRMLDFLVVLVGVLITLRHFGLNLTPALAGLGVGGIAVALAAQKTLENMIAGASLIFDQAVRTGDVLKMGNVVGTVEHIGLRSTRIRTPDRTLVSVPNSQVASVSLETLSVRDKFWFHPVVGIRPETTTAQLRAVVEGIRGMLEAHPSVDRKSVRVRFVRLAEFSFEVEVVAYVFASDLDQFLEIQQQLLFEVTTAVEAAGTQIAFRPHTMSLTVPKKGQEAADPPRPPS